MTHHRKPTSAQSYIWRLEAAHTKRRAAEIRRQLAQLDAGQRVLSFRGPANDR